MFHYIHGFRKYLVVLLTFTICFCYGYDIIVVHIGDTIPDYVSTSLKQARLFNPEASIYLIANKEAIDKKPQIENDVQIISCESLKQSASHKLFLQESTLDNSFREGFWRKATERFFFLEEAIRRYKLHDVFHIEYDNMLYVNLQELLPSFSRYKGLGIILDNDNRCIPNFIYIPTPKNLTHLVNFIAKHASQGINDMDIIAKYKKLHAKDKVDTLPIIPEEYSSYFSFQHETSQSNCYSNNVHHFNSIFDGAAIGQYLGGIDPRNGESKPGFINETCIFDVSKLKFRWIEDSQNRKIPYLVLGDNEYKINNLHIHSKNLEQFQS